MTHLRLCMLDVIQCQIELVIMSLWAATEFRATISQNADHPQALFVKEGQHFIVQQVRCRNWCLGCVELSGCPLRIGIDKGLLVNASDTLNGANIKRILTPQITGMRRFDFTMNDIISGSQVNCSMFYFLIACN